jgi:tRNA threonylcarbamoyl adenosine modification protein YeaZ
VIIVIDTSSARSALALIRPDGTVVAEKTYESRPAFDLPTQFHLMTDGRTLTKVAVTVGPGSFTGLRVGVSFGLGLAIGLAIPIVTLRTLHLQAARSAEPVLAVAEAGRGRVYFLVPGSEPGIAEPGDLPRHLPVVGWLRPATEAGVVGSGLNFKPEAELRTFGAAASHMLESAHEVAYGSLRLEYMQASGSALTRNRSTTA